MPNDAIVIDVRLYNFVWQDDDWLTTSKNWMFGPLNWPWLNNMWEMVVMTEPLMIRWSIGATLNVTSMTNTARKNCFRIIACRV